MKARLADALAAMAGDSLALSADRFTRLDVPKSWPVDLALITLANRYPDLRVGILHPFASDLASRVALESTSDPTLITTWRNATREFPVIVCGEASGLNEDGLREVGIVVEREAVLTAWRKLVVDTGLDAPGYGGAERQRLELVVGVFDRAEQGRLSPVKIDDYLAATFLASEVRGLGECASMLWRLGLFPDQRLFSGKPTVAALLARNFEAADVLLRPPSGTGDERLDDRLHDASGATSDSPHAAAAEAILEWRGSGNDTLLAGLELADIEALSGSATRARGGGCRTCSTSLPMRTSTRKRRAVF